jgi:hypothetical protein
MQIAATESKPGPWPGSEQANLGLKSHGTADAGSNLYEKPNYSARPDLGRRSCDRISRRWWWRGSGGTLGPICSRGTGGSCRALGPLGSGRARCPGGSVRSLGSGCPVGSRRSRGTVGTVGAVGRGKLDGPEKYESAGRTRSESREPARSAIPQSGDAAWHAAARFDPTTEPQSGQSSGYSPARPGPAAKPEPRESSGNTVTAKQQ